MPVSWQIRDGVLLVTTAGDYVNAEIERAFVEAVADGRAAGLPVLFDGRASTAALTKTDMEWRVVAIAGLPARGFRPRCAFVIKDEPHRYGLGRMLQMRLEPRVAIGVFLDPDEAVRWLRQDD